MFYEIISKMAFACVYVLSQQVGSSSVKITGKERAETVFRLFRNNINQLIVDYQNDKEKNKKEKRKSA